MVNMQSEINRLRNLTNLSITLNTPLPENGTNTIAPPLFPHVDSPTPQYFPPNLSLHKTSPIASKQSTNPQKPNFPQINPQQANPLPFTTPYVSQISFTQTPVIQTNLLTQTTLLTQTISSTQKCQATQHIPAAHTTIPNMQYVPQVYVAEAQPFITPIPTMLEVDPYEKMEKEASCLTLKDNIEAFIKEGIIQLKGVAPNVNNNLLPNHSNVNVNIITVDEDYNLEGTIVPVRVEKNAKTLTFISPVITVQGRVPIKVEVLLPKPKIMALVTQSSPFNTKVAPWN
ncbi:hypothetical protein H5410_015049 [Solanum commersonii]|uniref:Uncharacterized protein n=1 Tax=Solanum commersonii TaxID=4109 RepID=A0A9J5ZSP0_SOLCO|nr:hypothetical protein H5410_015049 [Solanum commersonii]